MKFATKKAKIVWNIITVIAVIAILAEILFPLFAKAREKARQTVCLSNLKQLGLAVMMYCQDYDETYSLSVYGLPPNRVSTLYDAHIPYIKNVQIFQCPSAPRHDLVTFSGALDFRYASYMGNGAVFEDGDLCGILPTTMPISEPEIEFPAFTTVFYDGWLTPNFLPSVAGIHNGGVNSIFCDGHAKFVKTTKDDAGNWFVANLTGYTGRYELWGVVYQRADGSYDRKALR